MKPSQTDWLEANQRFLAAVVDLVRARLAAAGGVEQLEGSAIAAIEPAEASVKAAEEAMPAKPAMVVLSEAFKLSHFERELLAMCAATELSSDIPAIIGRLRGLNRPAGPTFSLALALLPGAHWSAVSPVSPLRHWTCVEFAGAEGLVSATLRINERVLHFLAGVDTMDEHLRGYAAVLSGSDALAARHRLLAENIARQITEQLRASTPAVIHLAGTDDGQRRAVAFAVGKGLGSRVLLVRAADLPSSIQERQLLVRLLERESLLQRALVFVEAEESDEPHVTRILSGFIESFRGPPLIGSRIAPVFSSRAVVTHEVPALDADEQRAVWIEALGPVAERANGHLHQVVTQFHMGPESIRAAASIVAARSGFKEEENLHAQLWSAAREQSRPRLGDLAVRIPAKATWKDLVLSDQQLDTLRQVAAQVRQRRKVYEEWGFSSRTSRGLGISALFAGPSGTGKTTAAEVLATELQLDLYHIDLSAVVSKYIGETEKNLRRLFDAAEGASVILLFDEADALFGKRSEVKDSHDRYANIEVSYLLQRMEAYQGLSVLTTNQEEALDPAFLRRLRFVVRFPFPDARQREEIWRRIFPPETPLRDVSFQKLARLNVAGGNIRNVALQAAFLAADEQEPVQMTHLLRAARAEYAKIEKPLTAAETGGWA